jgi:hypothetical protein
MSKSGFGSKAYFTNSKQNSSVGRTSINDTKGSATGSKKGITNAGGRNIQVIYNGRIATPLPLITRKDFEYAFTPSNRQDNTLIGHGAPRISKIDENVMAELNVEVNTSSFSM